MKRLSKGFTLIELLIVIAVLGILAVAVLSAINPVEQINRSRDTGTSSDAEQLLGAFDRYYAGVGYAPWKTSPSLPTATDITAWAKADNLWTDGTTGVLAKLSSSTGGTSELKMAFTDRITKTDYNALYKYNRGTQGDSTYLCFTSQSNQFSALAWARCGSSTSGSGLPADLQPVAASICLGASLKNFSCLP